MRHNISIAFILSVFLFPTKMIGQWSHLSIVDTTTPSLTFQEYASTNVAKDGTLGVAWQEATGDRRNPIVFVKSTDQGTTFQKFFVVDSVLQYDSIIGVGSARILHDFKFGPDGSIWILWSYYLIYDSYDVAYLRLSKSINGGITFSQVFTAQRWSTTFTPQLAVARDSSVYVLWDDVKFKCTRFLHGDINLRTDAEIPVGTYGINWEAGISVDSILNVYCAWNGYMFDSTSALHSYIFCSSSLDSGKTFVSSIRIDTSEVIQSEPHVVASDSGHVFVIYCVVTGNVQGQLQNNVYLSVSLRGGTSFGIRTQLANSVLGSPSPKIILSDTVGILGVWYNNYNISISRSTDQGASFRALAIADPTVSSYNPTISSDLRGNVYMFVSSRYADSSTSFIYFSMSNLLTGVSGGVSIVIPNNLVLSQNYPNPFNPSTEIRYEIPTESRVLIIVYDMLGREIKTLVNAIQYPGRKSVRFDATGLPTGVYYYKITTDNCAQVRKMLLIR